MNEFLLFLLLSLGAYRVQRVITSDGWPPTKRLREWVDERFGVESAWADLVNCSWCVSLYTTAPIIFVVDRLAHLPLPLLWLAAVMAAVGIIAIHTED